MADDPFIFVDPYQMLPAYLKGCVRDLAKHGFCLVEDGFIREMGGGDPRTAAILQAFQECCRKVSIDTDQNLLIDTEAMPPNILVALAPQNHEGTLPEVYKEDLDDKGLHTREPLLEPDPTGPQLEIDAKFKT